MEWNCACVLAVESRVPCEILHFRRTNPSIYVYISASHKLSSLGEFMANLVLFYRMQRLMMYLFCENKMLIKEANMGIDLSNVGIDRSNMGIDRVHVVRVVRTSQLQYTIAYSATLFISACTIVP